MPTFLIELLTNISLSILATPFLFNPDLTAKHDRLNSGKMRSRSGQVASLQFKIINSRPLLWQGYLDR